METFRIFYLRDNVLDKVDTLEARDLLEAIERVSSPPDELTVEIWSDKGKVGIIGQPPATIERLRMPASSEPSRR